MSGWIKQTLSVGSRLSTMIWRVEMNKIVAWKRKKSDLKFKNNLKFTFFVSFDTKKIKTAIHYLHISGYLNKLAI